MNTYFNYFLSLFVFILSTNVCLGSRLLLQKEINNICIEEGIKVYKKINKNWRYPPRNEKKSIKSRYWKIIPVKRGEKNSPLPTFVLKAKTYPMNIGDTLEDLISKPALVECNLALEITKLLCLRKILGPNVFEQYCAGYYKMQEKKKWNVKLFFPGLSDNFLKTCTGESIPGSFAYQTNIRLYIIYKNGSDQGVNLLVVGKKKYIGFEENLFKKGPQSLSKIEEYLFHSFLKTDDVEKHPDEHAILCLSLRQKPEKFFVQRKEFQKSSSLYQVFDAKLIYRLMRQV